MTTSSSQPPAGIPWGQLAAPLALLGVLAAGASIVSVAWSAAALAGADAAPQWGAATAKALIAASSAGSLDPLIGPAGSRPLFWAVIAGTAIILATAIVAGILAWSLRDTTRTQRPPAALTRNALPGMRGPAAHQRATELRPSLLQQHPDQQHPDQQHSQQHGQNGPTPHRDRRRVRVDERDLGMLLGRIPSNSMGSVLGGERARRVYAAEEDVILVIAGPRSNKTSALVVPAILSAPGPVIATSNKNDIYTLTARLRAGIDGARVWVADPQHLTDLEQSWWLDPLAPVHDLADASTLLAHFTSPTSTSAGGGSGSGEFFAQSSRRLLAALVLAAAHAARNADRTPAGAPVSIRDVRRWAATEDPAPVAVLRAHGFTEVADGLQAQYEAPAETRGGIFAGALTTLGALENEHVTRIITPPTTWRTPPDDPDTVTELDPWTFIVGHTDPDTGHVTPPRDTLYLLTQDGPGSGAPVIAALVDHVLRVAARAAAAQGGRCDPPVRVILDEAANVCPIANLPALYSYFGSHSIQVATFLQSFPQGTDVWGSAGMHKLWGAATITLVGAGVTDLDLTRHLTALLGDLELPTVSRTHSRSGTSTSHTTRDKPAMAVADIAALDKRYAICLATGARPTVLELLPWYREPDTAGHTHADITAAAAQASADVRHAAITHLGDDNPLARRLHTHDQQEQESS
ncbi:type IV secretory system conjugative DNA transfer family protein [Pseudonocardia sp. ICBG601]|uniref:type IV secretory system conjugative DNA transfer family protein n=1 Tax=Pseudonocardia sp. ICBG601 TaxID=2846759 RepID=UPI001CF6FE87|nr:type IV secretory system conjugative DNA transfer family protein [Pseudonocardia sp. ICBG601]